MGDEGLSMQARFEVTKKYAAAYESASKKQKGIILDQVVAVTGWNRNHARQQLRARMRQPKGRATATVAVIDRRRTKGCKYSYNARKVLQSVWATSGGLCGKYLAASMASWLQAMETEGSLVEDQGRYNAEVRAELLAMSAATIDRYLAPTKATDPIRGKSTTRPGTLLRNSITIRKAGDEVETEPGFFEVDTVAHCGPTLKGEFCRSVNFTDLHTGWVFTRAIRNNAAVHVLGAFDHFIDQVPYMVTGIDCDNGSEFINHDLIGWAGDRKIFFTRSRPYKKNDQATIESKNNHLVRRYGFYHRYDTPTELNLLNQLWALVCDRLNYLTPTKKPTSWTTDQIGRRKRLYDTPATPYQRLLASGILNPAQQAELAAYKTSLKPAAMAHQITHIQTELTRLASLKTQRLEHEARPAIPNLTGIRRRVS
ncbi:transposase family protein [Pseudoclavibacter alba]|uniref:DDE-type integrase/transposase/recombinase n=1 Tax=Pseudoclavibacter albus TaxID=272241 RepID=A0ABT2HYT6_9MICO|nr:DDE-type integrase/transposase/recombinase [Pseudoclavibacter alba]MBN6778032.1 transposase family protein [Pseudoclavibacter alba]MCT2043464.1 DDE-type integrase/transposase/recombinase [Pseudoclavibacter alba]